MGRGDVPVYVGNPSALNEVSTSAEEFDEFISHRIEIHGATGLHIELPEASINPNAMHAVDFIIREAESNRGEIILVSVGPLTNLSKAI